MKKKYTGREWSQNRLARFQIGIIIVLLLVIYAFNYETYPSPYEETFLETEPFEIEQIVKIYVEKPPKNRQLKETNEISELIQERPLEIFKPELVSEKITFDPKVNEPLTNYTYEKAQKMPLPDDLVDVIQEIQGQAFVTIAERMPLYKECIEKFDNYDEQLDCTTKKLMTTIHHYLKYPAMARENGIEGIVIGSFIVTSEGQITEIKVERENAEMLDQSVIEVFKKLPRLEPGEQNNRKVNVKMYVPVHFKLSDK